MRTGSTVFARGLRARQFSQRPFARGPFALGLLAAAMAGPALGQDDVTIEATDLGDGLYMLTGQGGNIGLSIGPDGVFMIDNQFAPLTPLIEAKVAELNADMSEMAEDAVGDVRFIVNTHFHGDHTGGNAEWVAKGATIVAHDNVRARMIDPVAATFSGETPDPAAPQAWPLLTFTDAVTFHMNGETVRVTHAPNAHTDGDAVVHFVERNVIHMGDIFFNGLFPYIDVNAGGSVDGFLAVQDAVLAAADADTVIVPGHGALASKADLQVMRDVLAGVRDAVQAQIDAGADMAGAVAAKPLAPWADTYGRAFIQTDKMVEIVYASLTEARDDMEPVDHGHEVEADHSHDGADADHTHD